jgi:ribosomal protein L40E
LALSFLSIGLFAQQSSHELWGRFDFVSRLIWVEIVGSYESAQVNIGNQFSGNMQTAKSVINIEAMTMRVWVSEIESVIFGKDASRQLIRMRAIPDKASDISTVLKQFGESLSMIVAPTSESDLARAQRIGQVNALVGGASLPQDLLTQQAEKMIASTMQTSCRQCNASLAAAARFCAECGTAMQPITYSD